MLLNGSRAGENDIIRKIEVLIARIERIDERLEISARLLPDFAELRTRRLDECADFLIRKIRNGIPVVGSAVNLADPRGDFTQCIPVEFLEADDRLAQALAEVKRFTAQNRVLTERLNGKMAECAELTRVASGWKRKAERFEKQIKALDKDETFAQVVGQ